MRQKICRRLCTPHGTERMASASLPLRPHGISPSAFTLPTAGSMAFRRLCSIFSSLGVAHQQHDTRTGPATPRRRSKKIKLKRYRIVVLEAGLVNVAVRFVGLTFTFPLAAINRLEFCKVMRHNFNHILCT